MDFKRKITTFKSEKSEKTPIKHVEAALGRITKIREESDSLSVSNFDESQCDAELTQSNEGSVNIHPQIAVVDLGVKTKDRIGVVTEEGESVHTARGLIESE